MRLLVNVIVLGLIGLLSAVSAADAQRLAGKGKTVVLVSGDEEYRSEEMMPQLARILSTHHGFQCTTLFAIDPKDGTVNPEITNNIPGLEALRSADLMIVFLRFRDLPDAQMKFIADYVASGKPIIGIRTATHSFNLNSRSAYRDWSWKDPSGGFGRVYLGETWVAHHGSHGKESTRGIFAAGKAAHPILRGIRDGEIWGPTDVYTAHPPADADILLLGEVLTGMNEKDPPVAGAKNNPRMPVAWIRTYQGKISPGAPGHGKPAKPGRIFTTTMGSSQDFQNEAFRQLLVNATYWALGMETKIPQKAQVDLVGPYHVSPFKFGGQQKGRKPSDF